MEHLPVTMPAITFCKTHGKQTEVFWSHASVMFLQRCYLAELPLLLWDGSIQQHGPHLFDAFPVFPVCIGHWFTALWSGTAMSNGAF